jgi:exosortase A
MPPDALAARLSQLKPDWSLPAAWRGPLGWLGGVWLGLFVLLRHDWAAMAAQWWNSSTYNHILLIPAILAWLVHQRAPQLARLAPAAWWPGLLVFAAAMLLWVLGSFAGLAIVRQAGAVGVLIASALALLGPRVGVALAFPLGYMVFLVPFGEELVPPMQMVTAAMTVALVHITGISAVIEGVFIDTPAGLFEVAEACSGVKFLIAMLAFAVLAANVCFVSWQRRALFLAFALAVPVLANGVRAWATIFAAQYVGIERAAGFDHIVYGWVFFGVVIAAILAASWRFFDRAPDAPLIDMQAIAASRLLGRLEGLRVSTLAAAAALAVTALGAMAWATVAEQLLAPLPRQIHLPDVSGWQRVDYTPRAWWEPRAAGADHRLLGRYASADGRQVDVFLALYAAQGKGRRASGYGEGALPEGNAWAWQEPGPPLDGARSDRMLGPGRVKRVALTWYRTGDLLTGSPVRLSLANVADRLLLRARPTAMLILSAEDAPGQPAERALAEFRAAVGPPGPWMDRIARVR